MTNKGVKWLSDIRFDATESTGYWEERGLDVDAWIGRSMARVTATSTASAGRSAPPTGGWPAPTGAMVLTGAFLYFPALALYLDRPTAKMLHLWAAIALPVGWLALTILGTTARSAARSSRPTASTMTTSAG